MSDLQQARPGWPTSLAEFIGWKDLGVRDGVYQTTLQHGGRTTQVWDAVVTHASTGKKIALFRCTQLILYPR